MLLTIWWLVRRKLQRGRFPGSRISFQDMCLLTFFFQICSMPSFQHSLIMFLILDISKDLSTHQLNQSSQKPITAKVHQYLIHEAWREQFIPNHPPRRSNLPVLTWKLPCNLSYFCLPLSANGFHTGTSYLDACFLEHCRVTFPVPIIS